MAKLQITVFRISCILANPLTCTFHLSRTKNFYEDLKRENIQKASFFVPLCSLGFVLSLTTHLTRGENIEIQFSERERRITHITQEFQQVLAILHESSPACQCFNSDASTIVSCCSSTHCRRRTGREQHCIFFPIV